MGIRKLSIFSLDSSRLVEIVSVGWERGIESLASCHHANLEPEKAGVE